MPHDSTSPQLRSGAPSRTRLAAPDFGPKTRAWLARLGIRSHADLRRMGAVSAYVRLKREQPGVSLNLLYALTAALDGGDWRSVQRERKLELLMAVEDEERRNPPPTKTTGRRPTAADPLLALRNIGPAMRRDFDQLGIRSVAQLARQNPDRLYARIQALTRSRQDPCVWDTYAAAIHQARTGEALPWWHFTQVRKARERDGSFRRPPASAPARARKR